MANQNHFPLYGRRTVKTTLRSLGLLAAFHAFLFIAPAAQAGPERYKPKSYNQPSVKFYGRYGADLVNWKYIRADIIGQVKKAMREGRDVLGELDDYIVTNASGSVFVLPGVDADELTIINDASGNPIAIRR
ncbi:hypothetical protein [Kangiella sp. TOML190]|uniref:hypothetical protein n=1 Tax=Kangiella sp. TOML190 TaxID=2931351 RepID=UPI002041EEE1|nr:hypothetical protein [Kangiella sp. TOML190]